MSEHVAVACRKAGHAFSKNKIFYETDDSSLEACSSSLQESRPCILKNKIFYATDDSSLEACSSSLQKSRPCILKK